MQIYVFIKQGGRNANKNLTIWLERLYTLSVHIVEKKCYIDLVILEV